MPMVDRGGGREGKNHERRVKRGLNAKANPFEKKDEITIPQLAKSPIPHKLSIRKRPDSIIDGGCNLISRALARDQSRMLSRAFDGGVDAIITFCTDFERIEEVQTLVKSLPGQLYGAYGMHPDNVKRSNEKDLQKKLTELKAAALTPECIAIFCGLDFTRDIASHFPQERLLDSQLELALDIKLPVILTVAGAADRAAEKIAEWRNEVENYVKECITKALSSANGTYTSAASAALAALLDDHPYKKLNLNYKQIPYDARIEELINQEQNSKNEEEDNGLDCLGRVYTAPVAIFAFDGDAKALKNYLDAGCYIMLTGAICDAGDNATALRSLISSIPLDKLLLASDAPLSTPQNIRDEAIRTTRNEPSNLPFVLPVLVEAYNNGGILNNGAPFTQRDIAYILYRNSCTFFGIEDGQTIKLSTSQTQETTSSSSSSSSSSANIASSTTNHEERNSNIGNSSSSSSSNINDEIISSTNDNSSSSASTIPIQDINNSSSSSSSSSSANTSVHYRCRMCRSTLFTDADVMPHDSTGLRPSQKAIQTALSHGGTAITPKAIVGGTIAAISNVNNNHNNHNDKDDDDNNNKRRQKNKKGKNKKGGDKDDDDNDDHPTTTTTTTTTKHSHNHTDDNNNNEIGEVAVGRWHEAKGKQIHTRDQGMCRMLLIERQGWMNVPSNEPEGVLVCPGCQGKIGQYNLSGIKCGCGLLVTPAYKIPKNRVDAALQGIDGIEAAMLALDVKERGGVSTLGLGGDEEEDNYNDQDSDTERHVREKRKKVPVNKHKGNFSEFRNKST